MLVLNTETQTSATNEPAIGRQNRGSFGGIGVAFDENMFTHGSYLRAQGYEQMIAAEGLNGKQALFVSSGSSFLHLGRLNRVSSSEIEKQCDDLFRNSDAGIVVFEDVCLQDEASPISYPSKRYEYQANWRLPVKPGGRYISSKRARNLRWCRRKLTEQQGGLDLDFRFGKCKSGEVAAVAALNRAKILQSGGRHYLTDEKLEILNRVCAEIGYGSCLYAGGQLIAGNILCVTGKRAFGILTGYDRKFEKFSPGLQVTHSAMSELESIGCEEVNFLWGDNNWKSAFHCKREPLTTIIVRRNQSVLASRDYWKHATPYMKHALKAAAKPYVKRLLRMK